MCAKEPDSVKRHRPDAFARVLRIAGRGAVERGDDLGPGCCPQHRQQRPLRTASLDKVVLHKRNGRPSGHDLTFARTAPSPECGMVGPVSISVLVDATSLLDPGSSLRGFGRYVRAVLDSVSVQPDIEMTALAPGEIDAPSTIRRAWTSRRMDGRWTFYEHALRLGFDVARVRPDVFHSPINDPPMVCTRPWVQTLHDIIPM